MQKKIQVHFLDSPIPNKKPQKTKKTKKPKKNTFTGSLKPQNQKNSFKLCRHSFRLCQTQALGCVLAQSKLRQNTAKAVLTQP